MELFTPDGARQLQVDCGIEMQGGRNQRPQHSLTAEGLQALMRPRFSRVDDGSPRRTFGS